MYHWLIIVSFILSPGIATVPDLRVGSGVPEDRRVRPLDLSALQSLQKNRNGKGLLLNVWATWCAPCIEEFPDLERLHRTYGADKLDVVVVSIDFDDEVDAKVVPFLDRVKATMPAYINAFDKPLDLIGTLDPEWSGAVPATFLYDADGTLVNSVVGKQSLQQFERLVAPVLGGRTKRSGG